MQLQALLRQVPILETLGITVADAHPGEVTLRLPARTSSRDVAGGLHGAALMCLGQTAATVAFGTHPELTEVDHLLLGCRIDYKGAARTDVTARSRAEPEQLQAIKSRLAEKRIVKLDQQVEVLDGHGTCVALVTARLAFRRR